ATLTSTPTATATMMIPPLNKNSGSADNGITGGTKINCMAGTGLAQNELVLLAINLISPDSPPGVSITPPAPGPGIPSWNQIGSTISVGNYEQALFWHAVGTDVTEMSGQFQFSFSSSVRAACEAVSLMNTCLESPIGCPNQTPIFDFSSGTSAI